MNERPLVVGRGSVKTGKRQSRLAATDYSAKLFAFVEVPAQQFRSNRFGQHHDFLGARHGLVEVLSEFVGELQAWIGCFAVYEAVGHEKADSQTESEHDAPEAAQAAESEASHNRY